MYLCISYLLQNIVAQKLLIIENNVPVYIQHLQTDLGLSKLLF